VNDRNQALDLEDDWRELRPRPASSVQESAAAPADLESDWATLRNYPEHIYLARGDRSGLSGFSLWRMSVLGQKRVQRGPRQTDCWIVTTDKLLFSWGVVDNARNDGRYAIPKTECDMTFEEAAKRFRSFQEVRRAQLLREIQNHESQLRTSLGEIKRCKGQLESLAKVDLTPETSARDEKRVALLSTLVQRMEKIATLDALKEFVSTEDADFLRAF